MIQIDKFLRYNGNMPHSDSMVASTVFILLLYWRPCSSFNKPLSERTEVTLYLALAARSTRVLPTSVPGANWGISIFHYVIFHDVKFHDVLFHDVLFHISWHHISLRHISLCHVFHDAIFHYVTFNDILFHFMHIFSLIVFKSEKTLAWCWFPNTWPRRAKQEWGYFRQESPACRWIFAQITLVFDILGEISPRRIPYPLQYTIPWRLASDFVGSFKCLEGYTASHDNFSEGYLAL